MPHDPECLFCKIVQGELPATIVAEDETTLAFMDINPGNPGHLLVIPKSHAKDLLEISTDELQAVAAMGQQMARRVKSELSADGINLVNSCGAEAWQTVFHFHLHVIPRYVGDPLRLPWNPRPGDLDEIRSIGARLAAEGSRA